MQSLRDEVAGLLKEKKYEAVLEKIRVHRGTVRTLTGLLYNEGELVSWRAVTMFGRLAEAEPELLRPVIKRLLWFLNEESSTVGWGAAQALGEIAARNKDLAKGVVRVVVHFLDDDEVCLPANRNTPILAGAIWAIGNLAGIEPELTSEMAEKLMSYLGDPDPEIRALSAWALGEMGHAEAMEEVGRLTGDDSPAVIYQGEELRRLTVGAVAEEALDKMRARH